MASMMETDSEATANGAEPPAPAAAPLSQASRVNDRLAESLRLEHQLVKVPFEHLKKAMRVNSRLVEKEVNAVYAGVADAIDKDMSKEETLHRLSALASRLQGLKRKLDESNKGELVEVQRCRARLDHLSVLQGQNGKENELEWNNTRVQRILVDYMLRNSYYDTALQLANLNNIQELVDADIFLEARKVIEALRNRDCTEALAWCSENKSKLKKSKSKLEFKLRLQEFMELVRAERMMDAIMYSRKHLAVWGSTNMKELQQVMATLAFKSNTDCAAYKILFDTQQWYNLTQQFKQEFCKLYGMTHEPLLNIHLQAGLSALKTPFCYEEGCTKEDPLSQETIRKLADPLPFAKHIHSKLVCYITKEPMNENNPPLVLPNGYVYSTKAMVQMAMENQGKITCPRTSVVCNFSELAKAYIS
ncbi:protein MAEA homolog [Physcomitrium patens]|uniref:Macrophage erythroblast attacher n=1 Tax=Physcomitrium patens TaxID=3218 RepID=A9SPN7_PHYPA|nr:protein MAEA homolog [Physcomitrium patens]XP_024364677.1 protein MAEA homolog [Physcomitrium patens]PNR28667.1 hypothetical protein PHYPA_029260 [Physcomitrium patens]|eukprot:XP_024364676.1 protein MAEA homolog [Physcomitrella patens]